MLCRVCLQMNTWFTVTVSFFVYQFIFLVGVYMLIPISNQTSVFFCWLNQLKSWVGLTLSAFSTTCAAFYTAWAQYVVKSPSFMAQSPCFCSGSSAGPQAFTVPCPPCFAKIGRAWLYLGLFNGFLLSKSRDSEGFSSGKW